MGREKEGDRKELKSGGEERNRGDYTVIYSDGKT